MIFRSFFSLRKSPIFFAARASLRVAFFEGEQENAGGGHPSSRAKNRTFTPRNSHRIPDPQFVHVFGTTVRWFAPLFPVFDGPAPLTPAIRGRRAVQIASEVE